MNSWNSTMDVKICGITNLGNASHALSAGADFIGLNLVAGPRQISLDEAGTIVSQIDATKAVVLVDCAKAKADGTFDLLRNEWGVSKVQLYGDVSPTDLIELHGRGFETWLVRPIEDEADIDALESFLDSCHEVPPSRLLLDAKVKGILGGTGQLANWSLLEDLHESKRSRNWPPIILAGGLNPENVREASARVRPAGVDVCSGVESTPGQKDHALVDAFLEQCQQST